MCICVYAFGASKTLPLVVVHLRDEYLARGTLPPFASPDAIAQAHAAAEEAGMDISKAMDLIENKTHVACGVDLLAGGTWMGFNMETGNLTVLTNVRSRAELPSDGVLSRGKVVMDFVDGDLAAAAQAALDVAQETPAPSNVIIAGGGDDTLPPGATSMKMDGTYGGFNLISLNVFDDCHAAPDPDNGTTVTADAQQASNSEAATTSTHAVHVTNVAPPAERVETGRAFVRPLEGSGGRCVGGFSNEVAGRDGPGGGVWPKVQWLADRLGEALDDISALDNEASDDEVVAALLDRLTAALEVHDPIAPDEVGDDFSWSPNDPDTERHLQTHVYVPPYESKPDQTMYGSRYVVAVMRASDTVYYACRDIHATDWEVHPVAVPDSNGTDGDA